MPRLNRIRLGHIKYNNGRSMISDETFNLYEESTLLRMENGGGKSVMTQLLLSPYISAKSRKFPKRPFYDYFREPKPSFIFEEWQKDDEAGYFTVGMIVRKAQSLKMNSEELDQEDRRLDLYAFIAEYDQLSDPLNLAEYPVTVMNNGKKSYIGFKEAKDNIEDLAKKRPQNIRLYNLNTSASRKKYFETLQSLGIEQSEWEQLRDFNLDESGLSKFTSEYNTQDKLVNKVFLPAIEKKLNALSGTDHMQMFREMADSYCRLMIQNAGIYEQKKQREDFLERLRELHQPAADLLRKDGERLEALKAIASLQKGLLKADEILTEQIDETRNLIADAQEVRNLLQLEMYAQKYYRIDDLIQEARANAIVLQAEKEKLEGQTSDAQHLLDAMTLSHTSDRIRSLEARKTGLETKLATLQKSQEELMDEISQTASALADFIRSRISERNEEIESIDEREAADRNRMEEISGLTSRLNKEIGKLNQSLGSMNQILEDYRKQEDRFVQTSGISIQHTLSYYEDQPVLEAAVNTLEESQKLAADTLSKREEELAENENRILENGKEQNENALQIQKANADLKTAKDLCAKNQQILEKKMSLSRILNLSEEDRYSDPLLLEKTGERIRQIKDDIRLSHKESDRYAREIENLKTGCSLDLSDAVKSVMNDLGLPIQTGSEFLKEKRMPFKNKQKLIENIPFLPYSLVLSEKQIQELIRELKEKQIFTSSILPMVASESLDLRKKASLPDSSELHFYLHYNDRLIEKDALDAMILNAQSKKEAEERYCQNLETDRSRMEADREWLQAHPLSRAEEEKAIAERQKIEESLEQLQIRKGELEVQNLSLKKEKKELNRLQKEAARKLRQADEILKDGQTLLKDYLNACQTNRNKEQALCQIQEDESRLQSLNQENSSLQDEISRLLLQKESLNHELNALGDELQEYESYSSETRKEGSYENLKASYASLKKKMSDSEIPSVSEDLQNVKAELKSKNRLFARQKDSYPMEESEWIHLHASEEEMEDQKGILKNAQKQEKAAVEACAKASEELIQKETELSGILDRIEEKSGKREVLARFETRTADLNPEMEQIRKEEQQLEQKKTQLDDKKRDFQSHENQARRLVSDAADEIGEAEPVVGLSDLSAEEVGKRLTADSLSVSRSRKAMDEIGRSISSSLRKLENDAHKKGDAEMEQLLASVGELVLQPQLLQETLLHRTKLLEDFLQKIMHDLENAEKNRNEVEENLFSYIHRLSMELGRIDHGTTITLRGRTRKMLQVNQPKWDDNEALYRQKTAELLRSIVSQIGTDPSKIGAVLAGTITVSHLFASVIGLQNVSVKLYKVEQNNETKITWDQAGSTSGAESFLCAFTVVAAVLAYQRNLDTSIISNSRKSSVMLMDNPFAKAHSDHIIDALRQMCDAQQIQLVAFSAVENAAILNAFNTIYALRMIHKNDGNSYLHVDTQKEIPRSLEPVELHVEKRAVIGEAQSVLLEELM